MAQDGAQNANVYLVTGQVDGATPSPIYIRGQQNHNSPNQRFPSGVSHEPNIIMLAYQVRAPCVRIHSAVTMHPMPGI